jgi:hypothetical protein
VLEHIGMVAGVEGVTVTEHDPMLTARARGRPPLGTGSAEFV